MLKMEEKETVDAVVEIDTTEQVSVEVSIEPDKAQNEESKITEEVNTESDSVEIEIECSENSKEEENVQHKEEVQLTESESVIIEKALTEEEEVAIDDMSSNLVGSARNLLAGFKDYISSNKFDKKCQEKAEEKGVEKTVIKDSFIRNFLGMIANALNLTINIAGDLIKSCVAFVEKIISTIINFTSEALHKLVTLLTLNCGTN